MTPEDFKAWRAAMGLSQAKAAEALGVSKPTIENYERGTRREDGREVIIPTTVALACSAIQANLLPYGTPPQGTPKVFRIIISAPNDIERFTVDTIVKSSPDEHSALHELLKMNKPVGDEPIDRPLQNLFVSRK